VHVATAGPNRRLRVSGSPVLPLVALALVVPPLVALALVAPALAVPPLVALALVAPACIPPAPEVAVHGSCGYNRSQFAVRN